jgi:hypothetical protein
MAELLASDFGVVPGRDIGPGMKSISDHLNRNAGGVVNFGTGEPLTYGGSIALNLFSLRSGSLNFNGRLVRCTGSGFIVLWDSWDVSINGLNLETATRVRDPSGLRGVYLINDCRRLAISGTQVGGRSFSELACTGPTAKAPSDCKVTADVRDVFYPTPILCHAPGNTINLKAFHAGRSLTIDRARRSKITIAEEGTDAYNNTVGVNPVAGATLDQNSTYENDVSLTVRNVAADDAGGVPDAHASVLAILNGGSVGGGATPGTAVYGNRYVLDIDCGMVPVVAVVQIGVNETSHPSPDDPSKQWLISGENIRGVIRNPAPGTRMIEIKGIVKNAPIRDLTFEELHLEGQGGTFTIDGAYVGGTITLRNVWAQGITFINSSPAKIVMEGTVHFANVQHFPSPDPQPVPKTLEERVAALEARVSRLEA